MSEWLSTHLIGDRTLVQGLKGDATYLIVRDDGKIEDYGLNAVCTHLGCVVPWNKAENKFMCPCHGSQYDSTGKKVRGPAPLVSREHFLLWHYYGKTINKSFHSGVIIVGTAANQTMLC